MPVYEFECSKGHRTEDLVPVGTTERLCAACVMIASHNAGRFPSNPAVAKRVLSATPTTFHFADPRR